MATTKIEKIKIQKCIFSIEKENIYINVKDRYVSCNNEDLF